MADSLTALGYSDLEGICDHLVAHARTGGLSVSVEDRITGTV